MNSGPQKGGFSCQCTASGGKTFSRLADLERHYKNVHVSVEKKDLFLCDHLKFERSKNMIAFTRKDHLCDSHRDCHKEAIGCAKGGKTMDSKIGRKYRRSGWKSPKLIKLGGNARNVSRIIPRVRMAGIALDAKSPARKSNETSSPNLAVKHTLVTQLSPVQAVSIWAGLRT
jgi:hypothetical protein